jgi:hypothetical protein
MRSPEIARAITICWISLVPSKMVWILAWSRIPPSQRPNVTLRCVKLTQQGVVHRPVLELFCRRERAIWRQPGTVVYMEGLWTIEDVARYYRRSVRQARRIVTAEAFPPPVRGDKGRWVEAQVKAYAVGGWGEPEPSDDLLRPTVTQGQRIVRRRAA